MGGCGYILLLMLGAYVLFLAVVSIYGITGAVLLLVLAFVLSILKD
jgi:hypothetical protein